MIRRVYVWTILILLLIVIIVLTGSLYFYTYEKDNVLEEYNNINSSVFDQKEDISDNLSEEEKSEIIERLQAMGYLN